jgi:hypothetical protein
MSLGSVSNGQPSLYHGTFDDVPLNSVTLWASKPSQVLARRARLDRRQLHRRTAGGALRTLVLRVEHTFFPQFGTLTLKPKAQPLSSDARRPNTGQRLPITPIRLASIRAAR